MDKKHLKSTNCDSADEDRIAKQWPTIDEAIDSEFYIFRAKHKYFPIYFLAKEEKDSSEYNLYIVEDSGESTEVSELCPGGIKILNVKEVEPIYKLALDQYLASEDRKINNPKK